MYPEGPATGRFGICFVAVLSRSAANDEISGEHVVGLPDVKHFVVCRSFASRNAEVTKCIVTVCQQSAWAKPRDDDSY